MSVPFLDVHAGYLELKRELDAAVLRVLDSGRYVFGGEVEAFEQEFARYLGVAECVGVGNGLDALVLALRALDVGSGDEVIVPAHTFIATWLAVSAVGARPVPVEVERTSRNIDVTAVAAAVTSRTRAVIPVHLYGQPTDIDGLAGVAERHGLFIVEDAAQAHGARYRGTRVGGHGNIATWSFYPGKNLGAFGDGGAVTTDDPEIAERLRMFGNYGSRRKYEHELKGGNSRLDPVQAAVLRVKLRVLDRWNARRAVVAERYLDALAGSDFELPLVMPEVEPVWHLFVIGHPERDQACAELEARGVQALIHYPQPPHLQAAYAELGLGPGSFPVTESLCDSVLSLPLGPHISDAQVEKVIAGLI